MAKKSLPLKVVNICFLVIIGLLCLCLMFAVAHLSIQFKQYAAISDQYAVVSKAAINLQETSDYLTDQARLFVLTGDYKYLINYFEETLVTKRREDAVREIERCNADKTSIDFLKQALEESKSLESLEYYSMRLVVEGKHLDSDPSIILPEPISKLNLINEDKKLSAEYKIAKAWMTLFSQDYLTQKTRISELKSQAISGIFNSSKNLYDESLSDLKHVFLRLLLNVTGIFILNLIFFICIIALVIRPLYKHIRNIKSGQKLIETRTKEFNILSRTYNQMYEKNEANEVLLRHKAEHDELTHLLNRTAYNQLLTALSDTDESLAIILVDVDYFKQINDSAGHTTGDRVLQQVANALTDSFRTTDHVCRVGGDEFVVIMTNCDKDDSKNIELIKQKMALLKQNLSDYCENLPAVTLSLGISISHAGYNKDVYEQADKALYEVKRNGRNDFAIYQTIAKS